MINSEADIQFISYGAMLAESVVSIMAIIAATVMVPGDYFAINVSPEVFAKLGLATEKLADMERMTGESLVGRSGGAVSLAAGMSLILSAIPGMKHLIGYWYHFAIMFEALFILTTVDAGTRVARYILQEILKVVHPKLGSSTWMPAVLFSGGVISFFWGYLVYKGDISTIWPLFGVANQLLATLALFIGTVFILKHSRVWAYGLITFIPALFMGATTFVAGIDNILNNYLPKHTFQGNLNAVLSIVMLVLVIIISFEAMRKIWWFYKTGLQNAIETSPTETPAGPPVDIQD
jgi:carbon starvation protein